jgi:hypothetical protein
MNGGRRSIVPAMKAMRRLFILLALWGGHCHAFSSLHHGWRPIRMTLTLAMAPPVTQPELNGESITKATLLEEEEEDLALDLGTDDDDLAPIASALIIPSSTKRQLPSNWLGEKLYILSTAALIGILTGTNIAVFKTAVELLRQALYGNYYSLKDGLAHPIIPFIDPSLWNELNGEDIMTFTSSISALLPIWLIPAVGGILVGILLTIGDMPPGLRDTVKEVDLDSMRATNATLPVELLACINLTPASQRNDLARFSRKALAATVTLGTGNSLGPEGVSSERCY